MKCLNKIADFYWEECDLHNGEWATTLAPKKVNNIKSKRGVSSSVIHHFTDYLTLIISPKFQVLKLWPLQTIAVLFEKSNNKIFFICTNKTSLLKSLSYQRNLHIWQIDLISVNIFITFQILIIDLFFNCHVFYVWTCFFIQALNV